jgi:hypothetical protein
VAGSYELLAAPAFGAMVQAQTHDPQVQVYAVVYDIRTVSREPGGRAVVRGKSYTGQELFNDEIYRAHPDLSEVLQTEFAAWVVGYRRDTTVYQRIPAAPPPVHYSVEVCDEPALRQFGMQSGYARMLLQASQVPSDELLAALIRAIADAHAPNEREYLVRVGRELALLLRDDFERLRQILARLTS